MDTAEGGAAEDGEEEGEDEQKGKGKRGRDGEERRRGRREGRHLLFPRLSHSQTLLPWQGSGTRSHYHVPLTLLLDNINACMHQVLEL